MDLSLLFVCKLNSYIFVILNFLLHRENKTQQPHTAANAQRFNELYASVAEEVFVPKVYSDLTTRKVLVMEWVDGSRLTDSAYLDKYDLDRSKLIDTLVQSSIRQILENGT
jgi:predicted unusual protein kinase regulating ubiquinone biosynthesis (AarF/ABC1/UbiB family)